MDDTEGMSDTEKEQYYHAHKMDSHWLYLANKASERGDYDLEQRHLARAQKWHDVMIDLIYRRDAK